MKVVGIHHSDHVIDQPDLIALRPGNLRNPTIGIGITAGEHILHVFGRINGANYDDLRAVHGMARIRHAYTQITPLVAPYFTTPVHDDIDAVTAVYGPISNRLPGQIVYGLTTSAGMIGLIVAMVGGVLAAVVAMLIGATAATAIWIGVIGGVIVLAALIAYGAMTVEQVQAGVTARFPTPMPEPR